MSVEHLPKPPDKAAPLWKDVAPHKATKETEKARGLRGEVVGGREPGGDPRAGAAGVLSGMGARRAEGRGDVPDGGGVGRDMSERRACGMSEVCGVCVCVCVCVRMRVCV